MGLLRNHFQLLGQTLGVLDMLTDQSNLLLLGPMLTMQIPRSNPVNLGWISTIVPQQFECGWSTDHPGKNADVVLPLNSGNSS